MIKCVLELLALVLGWPWTNDVCLWVVRLSPSVAKNIAILRFLLFKEMLLFYSDRIETNPILTLYCFANHCFLIKLSFLISHLYLQFLCKRKKRLYFNRSIDNAKLKQESK